MENFDAKEIYSYYFHRLDLDRRGIWKYGEAERNEQDEKIYWEELLIMFIGYQGEK